MKRLICVFLFLLTAVFSSSVYSHCQLPCGIYHDQLVFGLLEEATQTIEKSVNEILHNSNQSPLERNQLVRWVINKENYADLIALKMNEYFLQQRIKDDDPKLSEKLISVHKILVLAMKVKQTVDIQIVSELKKSIQSFKELYSSEVEEHSH